MAFPLPLDPVYRKEIVWAWIGDIADRIEEDLPGAEVSWKIANEIYLTLPPGEGCEELESALMLARVKLDKITYTTNENNF
jgi:hypothetical protein